MSFHSFFISFEKIWNKNINQQVPHYDYLWKGKNIKTKIYYKLISDNIFKVVFCTSSNEKILKENYKLLKLYPANLLKNIYEKGKYLDILIKTNNIFVNIEINNHNYNRLSERNFSYITLIYASHIKVA